MRRVLKIEAVVRHVPVWASAGSRGPTRGNGARPVPVLCAVRATWEPGHRPWGGGDIDTTVIGKCYKSEF